MDAGEEAQGVVELGFQVVEAGISSKLHVWHVAEGALHDAAVLRADSDDPLFAERHAVRVRHPRELVRKAEKIGLHVEMLAVVADGKGFELSLGIVAGEKVAGGNGKLLSNLVHADSIMSP